MSGSKQPSAQAALEIDGATIRVSGRLTMSSVASLLGRGRAALAARSGQDTRLDLSGVTASDSAGLALIVDWVRTARSNSITLRLHGVPAQLASIADISGLGTLVAQGEGDEPG